MAGTEDQPSLRDFVRFDIDTQNFVRGCFHSPCTGLSPGLLDLRTLDCKHAIRVQA